MNKFSVEEYPETDEINPVIYKVHFANRYYVHKGKKLRESVDRFLDDIDRGTRDKQYPEDYAEVVKYCRTHPQVHKVAIEVLLNDVPAKLLKLENKLFKGFKDDPDTLNNPDKLAYRPEWMLKEVFRERCEDNGCIKAGVLNKKKVKFKFCPNCGRLNK
jgi:hypothetical protein